MTVSRRLRFEILRRDGYTCRYCGSKAPDVTLTVDHVVPVALGGGDEPQNLVTACADCNAGKSSIAPDAALVADVDATALLFAKAIERATAAALADRDALMRRIAAFNERWHELGEPPRPSDWEASVTRFMASGLADVEIDDAIHIAITSRASWNGIWRYFCGVCWNKIGERQEHARRLIENGEV